MNTFSKKKIIIAVFALLLLISIPLTLSLVQQRQDPRQRAAASTTLSFTPVSTASSPITKSIGEPISLDIMVDPGTNLVTFVKYYVTYDPTKVRPVASNPFTINSAVFSNVEGPVVGSNTVAQSVSIGSDPTKAIQKVTKVGTLNFEAIGATGGTPTTITYGPATQALSSGANDQAGQNVLSSTTPAHIIISGTSTVTPTIIPEPTLEGTIVSFTLLLHGVGAAGDNPNPQGNSMSNKNPLHPQRNLNVEVFNTNNESIASASAPVTYDVATGTFVGKMSLGKNVQPGNYSLKIKTDRYLRRLVPGIQQLKANVDNQLPVTQMVAGDTNNDNFLNVIDYNALLDCGYGNLNPLPIADPNSPFNSENCQVHVPVINVDIDDNGVVNSYDYNLFLRELSVQNGD